MSACLQKNLPLTPNSRNMLFRALVNLDISISGVTTDIDIDLNGELRTGDWDIGAYEFQ